MIGFRNDWCDWTVFPKYQSLPDFAVRKSFVWQTGAPWKYIAAQRVPRLIGLSNKFDSHWTNTAFLNTKIKIFDWSTKKTPFNRLWKELKDPKKIQLSFCMLIWWVIPKDQMPLILKGIGINYFMSLFELPRFFQRFAEFQCQLYSSLKHGYHVWKGQFLALLPFHFLPEHPEIAAMKSLPWSFPFRKWKYSGVYCTAIYWKFTLICTPGIQLY